MKLFMCKTEEVLRLRYGYTDQDKDQELQGDFT